GDTISVPVRLEGAVSAGVSAMDFRLNYDPAVLQPVGIETGSAAAAARKLVQANVATPGEYVVLMFGMNQDTIASGDIANINMRVVDGAAAGESRISIKDTTLSGVDAIGLDSAGSEATVFLDGTSTPDDPATPSPPDQKPPDSPTGEKPPPDSDPLLREPLLNIGPNAPAPLPPVAQNGTDLRGSLNPRPGSRRPASESEADFAERTQGLRAQQAGLPQGGASVDPETLATGPAASNATGLGTLVSSAAGRLNSAGPAVQAISHQPGLATRGAEGSIVSSAGSNAGPPNPSSKRKFLVAASTVIVLGAIVFGVRRYVVF
ncbi:MAG: cohesin domain-containing protein, partial [Candidatus Hydrogenedentota bacterium]